jgi:hypothetical protein
MSKERKKIANNIKSFINRHLTPVQIEGLLKQMSDGHSTSSRLIDEDVLEWPVPPWRQDNWAKEISDICGKQVTKEELFPDQQEREVKVKEKKKEKAK